MTDASLTSPHQSLRCRIINKDGAGLVRERLGQSALVELHTWFCHDRGGRSGRLLLQRAPVLDTFLARSARFTPEPGPPSPQRLAYAGFGAGLVLGSALIATQGVGSPFPVEFPFREAVDLLAVHPRLDLLDSEDGSIPLPALIALELVTLDPALDIVVEACTNLTRMNTPPNRSSGEHRFLFFIGLVASGISLPEPIPPREPRSGGRDRRSNTEGSQPSLFE